MEYLNVIRDQYDIIEDLSPGREVGAKTYLAFFRSDTECARVVLKELDEKRTAVYHALSSMWNPYIANVYCLHEISGNADGKPYSIAAIEYAGDISLSDYVKRYGPLSETEALSVCVQLCGALSPFHAAGFVHRDIKPDNIILYRTSPLAIKLTDFGSVKKAFGSRASRHKPDLAFGDTTVVGTIGYQAPESIADHTSSLSDIYSVGCVLNFMFTGTDPGYRRYEGVPVIRYIIRKATNKDPSMRFKNVGELERICQHGLRSRLLSKIPVLRSLPGYRSHTRWKSCLASIYYLLMAYELIILLRRYPLKHFLGTALFWFLIPLFALGNAGYLSEYLPDGLKQNNRLMFQLKAAVFIICLFVPLLFY